MRKIDVNKIQQQLIEKKSADSSPIQTTHCQNGTDEYREYRRKATVYFFKRLNTIYLNKFDVQFKTPEALQDARKEWALDIGVLTRQQIDNGLLDAKNRYEAGNKVFQWPNVGAIIGLANGSYVDPSNVDEGYDASWQHRQIDAANERRANPDCLVIQDEGAIDRNKEAAKKIMGFIRGNW
jgi:hypothetical protein